MLLFFNVAVTLLAWLKKEDSQLPSDGLLTNNTKTLENNWYGLLKCHLVHFLCEANFPSDIPTLGVLCHSIDSSSMYRMP